FGGFTTNIPLFQPPPPRVFYGPEWPPFPDWSSFPPPKPVLPPPFANWPPYIGRFSINQPPHDPNDLLGPSGYGAAGFLTPGGGLGYTIEFSNEKTAQVPADNVVVTEQLSPNLNWSTFQLGTIGFGSYVVNVPPGLTSYSTRVDATATLGVYVDVDASLNVSTGLLTVTFTSLDPTTLDTPANPLVGFLPPDTNPPNGEGYINYTIQPKSGLATGATLDAQASIVFDTNAAIATPQIVNTIDTTAPTSTVTALPATTTTPSFTVSWSGSDGAGSGIADYNVYVSDDGGPFTLFQTNTTATSATFTGQVGHSYAFYSVATSNVGLVQPTPTGAQATTTILASHPAVVQFASAQFAANVTGGVVQVVISRAGNLSASLTVTLSSPGGHDVAAFTKVVTIGPNVTSQIVTIPISNDGQPGESNTIIPLTLSSPGAGATLGAATTASLVIHDNNPTELLLQFSGALNAGAARNLGVYHLDQASRTKKGGTKYNKPVALASVSYNASTDTVTLLARSKLNLAKPEELRITASQLPDVYGRPLDGNDDGLPGGDFVALLTKSGVKIESIATPSTLTAKAVDALLSAGKLERILAHFRSHKAM
ncbi:MAG: hypothetical protein ABSE84_27325, partial [Isosphaeraceae bacterium]